MLENPSGTDEVLAEELPESTEVIESQDSTVDTSTEAIENPSDATDDDNETPAEVYYDIDGDEVSLETINEWKSGHMMQSDYTKKTQGVAEDRKKLEADRATVDNRMSMLSEIEEGIQTLVMGDLTEANIDHLMDTNPSEYLRLQKRREDRANAVSALKEQQAGVRNEIHAENYQKLHNSLEWDDSSKKESDLGAIKAFAERKGVTQTEFAQLTHPAIMEAFVIAEKHLKLEEGKPALKKRVVKAPKAPKPSNSSASPQVKSLAERMYGT